MDALTFMFLVPGRRFSANLPFQQSRNSPACPIEGRNLHFHPITRTQPHEIRDGCSSGVRDHFLLGIQLDTIGRAR
jgi:hypothetical protein